MAVPDMLVSAYAHALHESLGALLVGVIVAAMFFGVINLQLLAYFQSSKGDPNYLKLMIGVLWSLQTFQLVLHAHYAYFILVTNFANPPAVGEITWSISLFALLSETSDFIIRTYYIWRIWIMSNRSFLLTAMAAVLNIAAFTSGLGFGAKLLSLDKFSEIQEISWLMYATLSLGVAADLWSSLTLCYFLRKDGSHFQLTGTIVHKVAAYVIGTGVLTSFVAIACFVSFTIKSQIGFFAAIYGSLSILYFNALLATLNMRKSLREDMSRGVRNDFHSGTSQSSLESCINTRSDIDDKAIVVTVRTEATCHMD